MESTFKLKSFTKQQKDLRAYHDPAHNISCTLIILIDSMAMKLLALVGLACVVVAISTETETLPNSLELLQETEGNSIGSLHTCISSVLKPEICRQDASSGGCAASQTHQASGGRSARSSSTPVRYVSSKSIQAHGCWAQDGSGEKVAPTKAMASTYKGDINTSENKVRRLHKC